MVKHIGLFVVVGCQDNIVYDVFQSLYRSDVCGRKQVYEELTVLPLPLTSSLMDGVSQTL